MASCEDSEHEYLNVLYDCLAVAVDHKDWFGIFPWLSLSIKVGLEFLTEDQSRKPQQVRFQLYGSSAEDLHVDLFPDFDVMTFPTADELMIDDELIEYIPSNPLYVRIRGTDHPVLQSCLLENTDYVATSTLKNFHPAIFGAEGSPNNADHVVPSVFFPTLGFVPSSVKNSMTSPALKCALDVSNFEAGAFFKKLLNKLELTFHEHTKGGEESSISTRLSSEDETGLFKCIGSLFSEAKGLYDIIPAFRCLAWPMVAQEWRKRQRKWPSPDVVDKVIREGFHLVVKAPKKGGNPECDFRISFSHAEYLLSQEINEIQRECYRCLKTYHRVYLSTEPKGLITFHLKHIFLRTIEETGGEMWIESRRAECMSKLFANLLKALREKHLPLYFVRSYNLFGIDYIEDPAILESLTERVEQIMENPVKFAQEVILVTQGKRSLAAQEQEQMNSPFKQQLLVSELMSLSSLKIENTVRAERDRTELAERAELRKVYLDTIKDLTEAMDNADCILENLDPMERTIVEDLREIQMKYSSDVKFVFMLLPVALRCSEYTMRNIHDINFRHHALACVKWVTGYFKYCMRLLEAAGPGAARPLDFWSQMEHMLNPASENPYDWKIFWPPGLSLEEDTKELLLPLVKCLLKDLLDLAKNEELEDDIPLD